MGLRIYWSSVDSAQTVFLFLAIADLLSALWDVLDSVKIPANAPVRSAALAMELWGILLSLRDPSTDKENRSAEEEPLLSPPQSQSSAQDTPISSTEKTASLWSRLSFSWFNPVLLAGFSKPLGMENVYDLLDSDKSAVCHAELIKLREGWVFFYFYDLQLTHSQVIVMVLKKGPLSKPRYFASCVRS